MRIYDLRMIFDLNSEKRKDRYNTNTTVHIPVRHMSHISGWTLLYPVTDRR